jgi:hypothetical protein
MALTRADVVSAFSNVHDGLGDVQHRSNTLPRIRPRRLCATNNHLELVTQSGNQPVGQIKLSP